MGWRWIMGNWESDGIFPEYFPLKTLPPASRFLAEDKNVHPLSPRRLFASHPPER
jgi:hypothetical protein